VGTNADGRFAIPHRFFVPAVDDVSVPLRLLLRVSARIRYGDPMCGKHAQTVR